MKLICISLLIYTVILLSNCSHFYQDGRTEASYGENMLRVVFNVLDQDEIHYRGFMHTVDKSSRFSLYFDRGKVSSQTYANAYYDEDYGHYRINLTHRKGECAIYVFNQLHTHDSYADDYAQWIAVLGSSDKLYDSLVKGGEGLYFILTLISGADPPSSLLEIDHFESVKASQRDGYLAFELTFKNDSKKMAFPMGHGKIIGVLGRNNNMEPPVNIVK